MTPALRDRLMAERLFTAGDMASAAMQAFAESFRRVGDGQWDREAVGLEMDRFMQSFWEETLAKVQTHLSSDTSSIRAKKG